MANLWALIAGSVAGGLARYYLTGSVDRALNSPFPYGTFVVNLLGCFIIGFLSALSSERLNLSPTSRLLLMTGFCGAFTTFSTFMLETSNLIKSGDLVRAFLNVVLSFSLGLLLFQVGIFLGQKLN